MQDIPPEQCRRFCMGGIWNVCPFSDVADINGHEWCVWSWMVNECCQRFHHPGFYDVSHEWFLLPSKMKLLSPCSHSATSPISGALEMHHMCCTASPLELAKQWHAEHISMFCYQLATTETTTMHGTKWCCMQLVAFLLSLLCSKAKDFVRHKQSFVLVTDCHVYEVQHEIFLALPQRDNFPSAYASKDNFYPLN